MNIRYLDPQGILYKDTFEANITPTDVGCTGQSVSKHDGGHNPYSIIEWFW